MKKRKSKTNPQFKRSRNETMNSNARYWYRVEDQRDGEMQEVFEWRGLMLGKRLGHGISRCTYEYIGPGAKRGEWVVKMESSDKDGRFQNVTEWNIWDDVKDTPRLARWFAPCINISPCGSILIMARTKQRSFSQYPKRIPAFFNDQQYRNFGWIGNQLVCHDYGIIGWERIERTRKGLVKADWYGDWTA